MNFDYFLNHQTKTVNWAAIILSISALLSRFLGVVRDWLLARSFGAGIDLDIYFAAFKVPDFIYNILILGGVVVAFLPLFSEYFSRDKKEAWDFCLNCLNSFFVLLVFLSLLLFLFSPWLVKVIAPGFEGENFQKTVQLTRILLLSPILLGLSSIFSGVLQYFNRFFIYSLCPILYNLGIISGIIFLVPKMGIAGVAWGVIIGAFFHLAIQIPSAVNCGFSYRPLLNFKDLKIRRVFMLMMPRLLGISTSQINIIVINAIASTLAAGSISVFNFSNNIQYVPIGVIGASFAVAVFPALSKNWVDKNKHKFVDNFSYVFGQILYLIIPVSLLLFMLREQVVKLILMHGQFSLSAASLTSAALGLFCLGIFASSLIPLIYRAFFSLKDTKTPTLIAVISVLANIALSLFLTRILSSPVSWQIKLESFLKNSFSLNDIENISVLGLALAFSLSSIFQFVLSFILFRRKFIDFSFKNLLLSIRKILMAAGLMLLIVYFLLPLLENSFGKSSLGLLFILTLVSLSGFLFYFLITFILRVPESEAVKNLFLKIFLRKNNG